MRSPSLRNAGSCGRKRSNTARDGSDGVIGGVEPVGGERGFVGLVRVTRGEQPHGQPGGAGGVVGFDAQKGPERLDGVRVPGVVERVGDFAQERGGVGGAGGEGLLPGGHGVGEGAVARVREVAPRLGPDGGGRMGFFQPGKGPGGAVGVLEVELGAEHFLNRAEVAGSSFQLPPTDFHHGSVIVVRARPGELIGQAGRGRIGQATGPAKAAGQAARCAP